MQDTASLQGTTAVCPYFDDLLSSDVEVKAGETEIHARQLFDSTVGPLQSHVPGIAHHDNCFLSAIEVI